MESDIFLELQAIENEKSFLNSYTS